MRCIGLDIGFGYTKGMDQTKTIIFPSIISQPLGAEFKPLWGDLADAGRLNHLTVALDGETRYVGNLASHQGRFAYATLDRVRTKAKEYRFLFLTAISLLTEFPDEGLAIVAGLPVDDFSDHEWMEETFSGRFHLKVADREVSFVIRRLTVIPQPCGAFMDLLFRDTAGTMNEPFIQGTVGIIDVGFKTTDFALLRLGEYILKSSGSLKHGMSTIYQTAIPKFTANYPGSWDLRSAEEALSEGIICRLGERMPIHPELLEPEFSGLAEQMAAWVRQRWSDQRLDQIICTGGGSLLLKPFLGKVFPRAIFMDNPQQANVRGFYKGACYYYG
jgi:plasmid segregation protein ParM